MNTISVNRYARVYEILCMLLIPLVLLAPVLWAFMGNYTFLERIGFAFSETIGGLFILYGLVILIRITRLFQKNEIFTKSTVALFLQLRRISLWWALWNIAFNVFFFSFINTNNSPSILITALGVIVVIYLFMFVWLSIFTALIIKATELQGDQDLTV